MKSLQDLPELPFEHKTKKWGVIQVTAISGTDKGGLVEIDDGNHAPFWVRAKEVLGFDVY
jgi:hypothetical protein